MSGTLCFPLDILAKSKIQLSPKTIAEVEAERKMGTRFSSKLFLWRLPSSSWRVWSRAVVPLTKVSMLFDA